MLESNGAF